LTSEVFEVVENYSKAKGNQATNGKKLKRASVLNSEITHSRVQTLIIKQ